MKKYRVHNAAFKSAIVAEVEAGRSISELARENALSPNLIRKWVDKRQVDGGFEDRPSARESQLERELERAERKIGQMAIAIDILKKIQAEASQRMKRSSGLIATVKKPAARKEEPQK